MLPLQVVSLCHNRNIPPHALASVCVPGEAPRFAVLTHPAVAVPADKSMKRHAKSSSDAVLGASQSGRLPKPETDLCAELLSLMWRRLKKLGPSALIIQCPAARWLSGDNLTLLFRHLLAGLDQSTQSVCLAETLKWSSQPAQTCCHADVEHDPC